VWLRCLISAQRAVLVKGGLPTVRDLHRGAATGERGPIHDGVDLLGGVALEDEDVERGKTRASLLRPGGLYI